MYRIARTEYDNSQYITAYLTETGEYGTEREALMIDTLTAAKTILNNELEHSPYKDKGDFTYDIEESIG